MDKETTKLLVYESIDNREAFEHGSSLLIRKPRSSHKAQMLHSIYHPTTNEITSKKTKRHIAEFGEWKTLNLRQQRRDCEVGLNESFGSEESRERKPRKLQETLNETMMNGFMDLGSKILRVLRSVVHTSCVQNLFKLLLRLLWNLLHLSISIWYLGLGIALILQSYLMSSRLLKKNGVLNLSNLRYLAIVVDSEEARHTLRIVELLCWLSAIGVKHVCLYDMEGVLKESKEVILKELGDVRPLEITDERRLFLERKHIVLEFVSFSDGKEGVAKAASFLCSKYLKGASRGGEQELVFSEPEMTNALRAVGVGGPEPDLLLVYGPTKCHLGFPAWRLRYTEIIHMGSLKSMKYGAIVKSIRKFTMVKQNYGS
ncbi:hypothetical protein NE237_023493 [Protea cynaroides]|uniref:ditrans,polycis-polyprenyl diphosphate synthase [(2E,6E)-farnesyldiphosphate specific] n=1 Tax=Protea cynaroides TaxID=273540 RepID=A0A9Q0HD07_9MAGN|nr:hypothetical protein NE237_023493 [Protea cynaroides]